MSKLLTYFCFALCLIFQKQAAIAGSSGSSSDFSAIFGSNINKEQAWGKLLDLEGCPKPELWTGTVINVNQSLFAGAKFIANPNATSRYECDFECCYKKEKGCNIAVYAAEQKHCYLFDCGQPSKCKFETHQGYTVSSLATDISSKKTTSVPTTPPITHPSTTQAPPQQLHLLDGCRPKIDTCVTKNTECSSTGFCTCKSGYHPKNGVCRQDCFEGLQFECTNGDAKYAQPDCIAVYDVCDGTPQCPDGSDEKDCEKENVDWSKFLQIPGVKEKISEYMKGHAKGSNPTTTKSVAISDIQAILQGSTEKPVTKAAAVTGNSAAAVTKVKPAASVDLVEGNGTSSDGDDKAVVPSKVNIIMDESSRSAVIALSLTLTFTLVLAVYLGCRYKNMKKRVKRPGRPVNGSEVDYLIDGMYL